MTFILRNSLNFKKHISTEHAILQLEDKISSLFSKRNLVVFFDLSKAVDTVDYQILETHLLCNIVLQ